MMRRTLKAIGWWLMSGALERLAEDQKLTSILISIDSKLSALMDSKPKDDHLILDHLLKSNGNIDHRLEGIHVHTWFQKEFSSLYYEDALLIDELDRRGSKSIIKYNSHVFSQTYEDSAIAEIFSRIGTKSKIFVEVGVGDGNENTTRLLLMLGWRGLWIEANLDNVRKIRYKYSQEINEGRLIVIQNFVSVNNINSIIAAANFDDEIEYIGIDIDHNTSHVWRAIAYRPRLACVEYNAHFHPSLCFEVLYQSDAVWDGSNIFGASLKTLEHIGREKRMSLVGCDLTGINAYFVADELIQDHFLPPYTSENHYQPPRYLMVRGQRGHRRFDR